MRRVPDLLGLDRRTLIEALVVSSLDPQPAPPSAQGTCTYPLLLKKQLSGCRQLSLGSCSLPQTAPASSACSRVRPPSPWRAPPRLTSAPCRPPNPVPFSFTEHTSFGRVQEWVQRKMRLAAGESFQATYACDLLDGKGIREVMLDDGPS